MNRKETVRKYNGGIKGKAAQKKYLRTSKGKASRCRINFRHQRQTKNIVLARYGKDGEAKCCWRGCSQIDLDMLTLDHVNNDGAYQRRKGQMHGSKLYSWLFHRERQKGLQTLCWNHQWKKRALHLRRLHAT